MVLRVEIAKPRLHRIIGKDLGKTKEVNDSQAAESDKRRGFGFENLFTAFVDRVSKRIPKSALWRIFEAYGDVDDIFVAYRSLKRRLDDTTFAFVRFKAEEDLERAIREGNGRLMDGFKIVVSKARYIRSDARKSVKKKISPGISVKKDRVFATRDERSYKGVLIGQETAIQKPEKAEQKPVTSLLAPRGEEAEYKVSQKNKVVFRLEDELEIPEKELDWVDYCMVGVMKEFYEVKSIQNGMQLEGMPVTVCPWNGRRVIVRFESKESMDKLLVEKWSFFDEWFSKLESLDPVMCKREVRYWISLENVPVFSWHPQFFEKVTSRWGVLIDLHKETRDRVNFERARLLVGVENVEVIPAFFTVALQEMEWKVSVYVIGKEGEVEFSDDRDGEPVVESSDESTVGVKKNLKNVY